MAQVLQNVLTAEFEHSLAVVVAAIFLFGKLSAGDTLWDVPHPGHTAALQRPVALSCRDTQGSPLMTGALSDDREDQSARVRPFCIF